MSETSPSDATMFWGTNQQVVTVPLGEKVYASRELRLEVQVSPGWWSLIQRTVPSGYKEVPDGVDQDPRHWPDDDDGRAAAAAYLATRKPDAQPARIIRHTSLRMSEVVDV